MTGAASTTDPWASTRMRRTIAPGVESPRLGWMACGLSSRWVCSTSLETLTGRLGDAVNGNLEAVRIPVRKRSAMTKSDEADGLNWEGLGSQLISFSLRTNWLLRENDGARISRV